MTNKEEITQLLIGKISRSLEYSIDHEPRFFLKACLTCFKLHEEQFTSEILRDVITQAGEECKVMIDDLVNNTCGILQDQSLVLTPPDLLRIHCPVCDEDTYLIVDFEVYCNIRGIALDLYDYEPIAYGINYEGERSPEYECFRCGASFTDMEANKLKKKYMGKEDRFVETDIDIFEEEMRND
ncbi:MAG: hypothetical protein ACYSTR_02830 [Planctomycetota bacterium]|jgi:hypothetical protein